MTKSVMGCLEVGCLEVGGRSTGSRLRTLLAPLCLALALQVSPATAIAAGSSAANAGGKVAGSAFEHDGWQGYAYNDDSGQFTHCAIAGEFEGDINLTVIRFKNGSWTLSLLHEAWSLGDSERYQVSLSIDSRAERTLEATGAGRILYILVGQDDRLYKALGQGHLLTVFAAKETFAFSLEGTSVALRKLRDCVLQHGVTAQSSNPFAAGDQGAEPSQSSNPFARGDRGDDQGDRASHDSNPFQAGAPSPPVQSQGLSAPPPPAASARQAPREPPGPDSSSSDEDERLSPLIPGSLFHVAGWTGSAYGDQTGQFDFCGAASQYAHGVDLAITLTADGSWTLSLRHGVSSLWPNESYPVSLEIDRQKKRAVEAEGGGQNLLLRMGQDEGLYEALMRARLLTVLVDGTAFHFSLEEAALALRKLRDCVRQHGVATRSSGSFGNDAPSPPAQSQGLSGNASPADSTRRTMEVRSGQGALFFDSDELRDLLIASGAPSPAVDPPRLIEAWHGFYIQQSWTLATAPSVQGQASHFIRSTDGSPDGATVFDTVNQRLCPDSKAVSIDDIATHGEVAWTQAVLRCENPDPSMTIYMTGLFGADETLVISHMAEAEDAATARAINEELSRRILDAAARE